MLCYDVANTAVCSRVKRKGYFFLRRRTRKLNLDLAQISLLSHMHFSPQRGGGGGLEYSPNVTSLSSTSKLERKRSEVPAVFYRYATFWSSGLLPISLFLRLNFVCSQPALKSLQDARAHLSPGTAAGAACMCVW